MKVQQILLQDFGVCLRVFLSAIFRERKTLLQRSVSCPAKEAISVKGSKFFCLRVDPV